MASTPRAGTQPSPRGAQATEDPQASAPHSAQALADALGRVSLGDKAALKRVYAATSAQRYGLILRIVGDRHVADDVLQDVYLRVWQRAAEFDLSHGSPFRWLATIARNRALDARPGAALSLSHDLSVALGNEKAGGSCCVSRRRRQTRLFACLAELGTERCAIVLTAYFFGMTRRQIAERSGQPPARVKAWLRASLSDLRAALDAAEAKREAAE